MVCENGDGDHSCLHTHILSPALHYNKAQKHLSTHYKSGGASKYGPVLPTHRSTATPRGQQCHQLLLTSRIYRAMLTSADINMPIFKTTTDMRALALKKQQ